MRRMGIRGVTGLGVALALAMTGTPAMAMPTSLAASLASSASLSDDPAPPAGHASLEDAVQVDLGMSMADFVAAGVRAEAALELDSATDTAADGSVAVQTPTGIERQSARSLDRSDGVVSSFTDLEALRTAYLEEVGPEGLTGLAYTLSGFEIMVTDPDRAYDRGRTGGTGEPISPTAWALQHGVAVAATDGPADPAATLRGGSGISFGSSICTHGFNGYYKGSPRGISAGHCAYMGGTKVTASAAIGTVDWWQFGAPGSAWESYGTDMATYTQGSNYSYPSQISAGSSTLEITGRAAPALGMPVCKMGRKTGWACAKVNKIGWQWIGDGSGDINRPKRWVWSLFADTRVIPGDSGGPWVTGHKAVGVTSSYDMHADGRPYATASLVTKLDKFRPGAQVKVWLGRAKVTPAEYSGSYTAKARWAKNQTISGTLTRLSGDSVSAGTVVDVWVDGTRIASPSVASNGAFSFTYSGSDSASHKVTLRARSGDSRGKTVTVTDQPAGTVPKVIRHTGSDRYAVAAEIARTQFGSGVDTVYVASGQAYPDALAGSARAGSRGAPVLLTSKTSLPKVTREAIIRLAPARIVILGGTATVSTAVQSDLAGLTGSVERVGGADRYAVAANLASYYPSAKTVFVASGTGFADALAAAGRAGVEGVPLLLTAPGSLPATTAAQLERLSPDRIVVVGGPATISAAVLTRLQGFAPTVTRVGGADRYEVAANLARMYPAPTSQAWIAKGTDFPDALAAAPAAALHDSPVLLTRPTSLPAVTRTALSRLKPSQIHIAGGEASVAKAVADTLRWLTFP